MDALRERLQGEPSKAMCDDKESELMQTFFQQLQRSGTTYDVYLKSMGLTSEQFRDDLKKQAKVQCAENLALNAYAKAKGISVTAEEISAEFVKADPEHAEELEAEWRKNGQMHVVRGGILREKAFNEVIILAEQSQNVKKALLYVTGVKYKELIKQWYSFYQERYQTMMRELPTETMPLKYRKYRTFTEPAVSPDGRHIAYVSNDEGKISVFVEDLKTGKKRRLYKTGHRADTWVDTSQWSDEVWDLVDPKYLPYIGAEIKLNSANKYGGPALLVACVTQLTGLPISHYAEIDMDGFISLVDAVGGIEVNIPVDLYDPQLDVSFSAGWQTLTGDQALDLCRMRYAYEQGNTGYGHGGDVYRAANQRMVISALLKKILASDMSTLLSSVSELSKFVAIDRGLGLTDLASLAMAFKGLDSATDIYSTRIPTVGGYVDQERWSIMVSRMSQGLSPVTEDVIDPESGTILQSAGTGDITDLTAIDSTYTQTETDEAA